MALPSRKFTDYEKIQMRGMNKIEPKETEFFRSLDFSNISNVWDLLNHFFNTHSSSSLFGKRVAGKFNAFGKYKWFTYAEIKHRVMCFAQGLNSICPDLLFSSSKQCSIDEDDNNSNDEEIMLVDEEEMNDNVGQKVAIMSLNRPEYQIAAFALIFMGVTVIPIYPSIDSAGLDQILAETEVELIICDLASTAQVLNAIKRNRTLKVSKIVQMDYWEELRNEKDRITLDCLAVASKLRIELHGFSQVLGAGESGPVEILENNMIERSKSDIAYIIYTSGTTGKMKGVMISNETVVHVTMNGLRYVTLLKGGSYLSYMPLAHCFEISMQYLLMVAGCSIAFYSESVKLLASDIRECRPFYFAGVPSVFQGIYRNFGEKLSSKGLLARFLTKYSYKKSSEYLREHSSIKDYNSFLYSKIWPKIRKNLGLQNLKLILCGGAPISPNIMEFLRVLIPGNVVQGYGLTETFAVTSLGCLCDTNYNNVGFPVGCSIKFAPVPNTQYSPENTIPSGEILIKGKNLFSGYYKGDKSTVESFRDGWFCTGDIGRLNPNGTLSIIDRIKTLSKLSNGEYIVCARIESVYSDARCIRQIFVHAESEHSFVVAIVVPNVLWLLAQKEFLYYNDSAMGKSKSSMLRNIGKKTSKNNCNDDDLMKEFLGKITVLINARRQKITEMILDEMRRVEGGKLKRFERVKRIYLMNDLDGEYNGFTISNGGITASLKLRRDHLKKVYESELNEMFNKQ